MNSLDKFMKQFMITIVVGTVIMIVTYIIVV